MPRSRKWRLLAAGAVLAVLATTVPAQARPAADTEFRVNPYLQNPSTTSMTITWFTSTGEPGDLVVRGPGLRGAARYVTEPEHLPALDYTPAELEQHIEGLEPGSWLHQGGNYKHSVDVTGLQPGRHYVYTVRSGADRFHAHFTTAPSPDRWSRIRFVALADSETEPLGRVQRREWAPGSLADDGQPRPSADAGGTWDQTFGTTILSQVRTLRYMLTEDAGYRENLRVIDERRPDFVVMPGDLVQGGGYQPGWDEFFRHNAGEHASGLSYRPILPAIGNWENFGALNGGYGTAADRSPVVRSRAKYHAYFDSPDNGTEAHRDNYYRVDYGPVTVITLDSSNGEPDDHPSNYPAGEKATGQEYRGPGTDTQNNYTRAEYEAAGGTDLADLNPGSVQWNWAEEQLAAARDEGQIVFVQFHHAPFSSGEHGLPMYHELTSGQGGTPMRQYHDMFAEYGVVAVLSGHSEMFERSFVDDGAGSGVHYYDVGVAGDGLRGERRAGPSLTDPLLRYNPYRQWTADQDAPERWEYVDGTLTLVDGGKHYGHLEVNVQRLRDGARVTFTPVYVFPIFDADYELVRTERREYGDEIVVEVGADGVVRST
ncbi:purple acid phosphatase family protein [Phytoactinopolyspora limicola]|uniref:purple acid phosphatase family protein n=1 Tax=Phytoactinopolyspora limicola TaxID=2715536 RepID=UPI00140C8332|nr:metallophosphoesterase family protein [Phytoactinopolyspora limicola]